MLSTRAQRLRQLGEEHRVARRQLEERATALYSSMLAVIKDRSPLGLLALEGLTPRSERPHMEQLLGAQLWSLRPRMDALGARIDLGRSRVRELLPGASPFEAGARPPDQGARGFQPAPRGAEHAVIAAALDGLSKDGGWFPLVHEPTLHYLVEVGDVPRDSWTYVVWSQYVTALGRALAERRADDEAVKKFWSTFSKASAVASLALLASPGAKLGLALRGASGAANLVLLAHAVWSVAGQLDRLEELQKRRWSTRTPSPSRASDGSASSASTSTGWWLA